MHGLQVAARLLLAATLFMLHGCDKPPNSEAPTPGTGNSTASTRSQLPSPHDQQAVDDGHTRELSSSLEVALTASLTEIAPKLSRPDSYVSSDACVSCHPNEHASWHKTYHRTMTQLALPGNVLSDFQDTTIQSAGLKYRVFRKGDEYWAELPDPDRMLDMSRGDPSVVPSDLPLVQRRVVMTTGSHHYQTYWVGHDEMDTVMNTLPLVYLPAEERWIPREAAFVSPPSQPHRMITIWNDHCINCHATGGNPGLTGPKSLATSVGELGISCEACHGPGENHVAHHEERPTNLASDSNVVLAHPKKLDPKRSSQICGQCHGVFIRRGMQGMKFAREGIQFRPGEDLHASRYYVTFPDENSTEQEKATFQRNRQFYRERWWDDGTMLAGGREYSAMLRTPCYMQGEMSCLSCHSMHNADPDNQLSANMEGNQACVQCHTDARFTTDVAQHTHHRSGSSGSECMNCHMPHTSYALFSAIRNHTITSPNVLSSVKHGVPNACNLCHLDKSLGWTQNSLTLWYQHEPQPLSDEQEATSAAVLWLLTGHAAQRVIVAWHLGWQQAQDASSIDWMLPVLAQVLADPYGVVRHVAERSLDTLLASEVFAGIAVEYDFLGSEQHHYQVASELLSQQAKRTAKQASKSRPTSVPNVDGLKRLLLRRDDRHVSIKE